jgi:hypothetical protein
MKKILFSVIVACGLSGCLDDTSKPQSEQKTPAVVSVEEAAKAVEGVTPLVSVPEYPPNTSSLWKQFLEARRTGEEPELADFSYAGYHWGEKPIPSAGWKIFDVTQFGARPNDGKSDKAALIKAIAAAEIHGSGIVFFPAGKFLINELDDPHNKPILIRGSKIVLRGSGSGEGGTELYMDRHMDPTHPDKLWTCPYLIQFKGEGETGKSIPVIANSRRESRVLEIDDASVLKAGDWVVLKLVDKSPEGVAAAVAPYKPDPAWKSIIEKGVLINEFHCIESIEGNRITFKEPIHADVEAFKGWILRKVRPLEEIGVEEIAFSGNWHEKFVHHKNAIHDGGWSMISLSRCVNSWIRECRFTDFNRPVKISGSSSVTVEDLTLEGTLGHSAVGLNNTTHSMVRRVTDTAGHWHASGVAGTCSGNVFLRSEYRADTCYESHASQPRWTLFDNIAGGWVYGRWGGAEHNQPNHLEGLVFWNYKNIGSGEPGEFHFMRPDSKYGRIIMPYVIGFHGNAQAWVKEEIKLLESNGTPVYPESLYEAQVELRMKD